ncbi:hypothetical protein GOP47_0002635 [Adiantum capillus-veneris]|uniref:Uncharacterized protein n=1 Tax=Adiantum capillus-veneris TaxID=13818 RepID=A0A9D4VB13_ADICA|nr:hypothetical protein GOP47_0002635 [Adiantum capillus-veneris]
MVSFLKLRPAVAPVSRPPVAPTGWQRLRCCGDQQKSSSEGASPSPRLIPLGFPRRWPSIGIALSSLGFIIGPVLDGIHSNAQLLVYDNGAVNIGPLQTNVLVPPFLGVFYGVIGLLQLVLDNQFASKGRLRKTGSKRLLFSLIFLILILELSAEMYKAGTPYNIEAYVLFALAELNWYLFDGTWWGFGLAAFVGVCCPLAEIPLMKYFDLWHYPKANVAIFDEGLRLNSLVATHISFFPYHQLVYCMYQGGHEYA